MMGHRGPMLVLVALLSCANAALAWQIYRETRPSLAETPVTKFVVQATTMPQLDPIAKFEMPQEDRFAAIRERPLFSPSRRPPPGAEGPSDAQSSDLYVILTGIVYSESERIVLLRSEGSHALILLQEGQSYNGWTLAEIGREQAIFRNGGREVVLELVFETEPIPQSKQEDNKKKEKRKEKEQSQDRFPSLR